jgi:hypothetical protein
VNATQLLSWDCACKYAPFVQFSYYKLFFTETWVLGSWLQSLMLLIMLEIHQEDLLAPIVTVFTFPNFSVPSFSPKIDPSRFGSYIKGLLSIQNLVRVSESPIRTRLLFSWRVQRGQLWRVTLWRTFFLRRRRHVWSSIHAPCLRRIQPEKLMCSPLHSS